MMRLSPRPKALVAVLASALVTLASSPSTTNAAAAPSVGCMDQWLFNGVWRVKITKVEPQMDGGTQVGWQVTEVWRNGTDKEVAPGDTLSQPQVLELKNGSKISTSDTNTASMSNSVVSSHDFPASGQFTYVQIFRAPGAFDPTSKPVGLDVTFDAAKESQYRFQPHFTTGHSNFHFKLDCEASAAVANAAGGSSEIPGVQGCMNQWMSNGIWRVRVTAIGPDSPDGTQIGYAVTEQWTNQTKRQVAPADTAVTDQQLVLANGDTIASSNSAGSTMSSQKLDFHEFAPGESMTYVQLFRPSGFNDANKPVKLIITFDAKAQNQKVNGPHYTAVPPNYRISLGCVK